MSVRAGSQDLLLQAPLYGAREPLGKRNIEFLCPPWYRIDHVCPQEKHIGSGV